MQGDHFVQMRWDDEGGARSPAGDLEVELGAEGYVEAGEDLVFCAAAELVQLRVDLLAVGQVVGDGEPDDGREAAQGASLQGMPDQILRGPWSSVGEKAAGGAGELHASATVSALKAGQAPADFTSLCRSRRCVAGSRASARASRGVSEGTAVIASRIRAGASVPAPRPPGWSTGRARWWRRGRRRGPARAGGEWPSGRARDGVRRGELTPRIAALLAAQPDVTAAAASERLGVHPGSAQRVLRARAVAALHCHGARRAHRRSGAAGSHGPLSASGRARARVPGLPG
ncbi:hypothetical protein B6E66_20760 [Streptomyces maremycinicus]|nr:hypothetical protein B6E66_20760 [Streptomyces sp. B9173]